MRPDSPSHRGIIVRFNICSLTLLLVLSTIEVQASDYVVVIDAKTYQQQAWKQVADALIKKHDGELATYEDAPREVLETLQQLHPRYTCFVAPQSQVSRQYVADVHQLTRKLDDDPYTDTMWGILTGYNAANALAIAEYETPLTVRKVAAGTEFALDMCEEGLWYDELVKNKYVRKERDGEVQQLHGPDDTTKAVVETLNEYRPDLFITSGHATERNWQLGFRYRNGYLKSEMGQMVGEDIEKERYAVNSPNPKVYLPIGNCLMGHIDTADAMALAWMNDVGVKQMIGYTVPTWFGYGGWGVLDYFVEQPGRYTLAEAFFANHHALIHALETKAGNQRGMAFDRDVVAFYGDPKWEARMKPMKKAYDQRLTVAGDTFTFTIQPQRGADSFKPINTNGAQRGWRPIVHWLPNRIQDVTVLKCGEFKPVITDDFILVPNPRECSEDIHYEVVFQATPVN